MNQSNYQLGFDDSTYDNSPKDLGEVSDIWPNWFLRQLWPTLGGAKGSEEFFLVSPPPKSFATGETTGEMLKKHLMSKSFLHFSNHFWFHSFQNASCGQRLVFFCPATCWDSHRSLLLASKLRNLPGPDALIGEAAYQCISKCDVSNTG